MANPEGENVTNGTGFDERLEDLLKPLVEAVRERSSLDKLLLETHAAAARQRSALEQSLRESKGAYRAQADQLDQVRAELAQAAADFDKKVDTLSSERESLRDELKNVKRKYRATQHDLSRDRVRLRRTQERLTQAEQSLELIKSSAVWRTHSALIRSGRRLVLASRRLTGGVSNNLRSRRAALIRRSSLFDATWYLARYPDVEAAGRDPAVHYLEDGWKEGRDPGPSFGTNAYLRAHADVARSDINPLLHYIEFGYAEGRSLPETGHSPAALPITFNRDFCPPANCVSFPVEDRDSVRWLRSARLAETGRNLLVIEGQPIGFEASAAHRESTVRAFARLAAVSGYSTAIERTEEISNGATERPIDTWLLADGRVRTRWQFDGAPTVVRAYQHDPNNEGALSSVGEGLVTRPLDFVDFIVANPNFPLLFVLSEPDGTVRTTELLAFPSLCRGGLHYSELLAISREEETAGAEAPDLFGTSAMLAARLLEIFSETALPLVSTIDVDQGESDGSEPLFQSAFRAWLSTVMRIAPCDYVPRGLEAGTASSTAHKLRGAGGRLVLPADAIPTISSLVAHAKDGPSERQSELSLLIAGRDAAQPSTLLRPPAGALRSGQNEISGHPALWPALQSVDGIGWDPLCATAIRHNRRLALSDAELLVPVAAPGLPVRTDAKAITWLVFPEDWSSEALAQGLEALSLQQLDVMVALVGDVEPSSIEIARILLGDNVGTYVDVLALFDEIRTPLIGYLGPNVILHDGRTSAVLSSLLEDIGVVSASCALVSTEKRGRTWSVQLADPGTFLAMNGEEHPLSVRAEHAQLLWRSSYQALRPPRDLWVGRSASVRGWIERAGPLRPEEGVQLCTSLVTASYVADPGEVHVHLRPPAAAPSQTIRSEVIFG